MSLIFDAALASFEMIVVFFFVFLFVFLLAVLLFPVENRLSMMVWRHAALKAGKFSQRVTYKQFSQKHR